MGYTPVKNFLRRHMQHPRLYAYARRVLLVGQYLLRIPDEPDYNIFSAFRQRSGGTLVDVGTSNAGAMCPGPEAMGNEELAAHHKSIYESNY